MRVVSLTGLSLAAACISPNVDIDVMPPEQLVETNGGVVYGGDPWGVEELLPGPQGETAPPQGSAGAAAGPGLQAGSGSVASPDAGPACDVLAFAQAAECPGTCFGTCTGECSAIGSAGACAGACAGLCVGSCDPCAVPSCEVRELPGSERCDGTCHGSCTGNCDEIVGDSCVGCDGLCIGSCEVCR